MIPARKEPKPQPAKPAAEKGERVMTQSLSVVASRPIRKSVALAIAVGLLLADVALRIVQPWVELRIGVLTALIGAPFFVWLVLKTRAELAL